MTKDTKQKAQKPAVPAVTGSPFDMRTDPTVPKALGVIQASEQAAQLTAMDRKLFNWLLAVAYPDLMTKEVHTVAMADARAYLGGHESNDQVRASMKRLSGVALDFDYLDADGNERWATGTLLWASGPKFEGVLRYQFPADLRPLLGEPAMFARLRLAVMGQFRSKYGVILYELLELYANRERPVWRVTIEDLRALLGVKNKMPNFKDFRANVLTPALLEINDKSDLTVPPPEEVKEGRRVSSLIFTITKKTTREAFEAELRHKAVKERPRRRRARDTATPDLLDGRTDRERGGPPWLKADTIAEARKRFPGWDIEVFERQWMESQEGREPPRSPDRAFLSWLEIAISKGRLPE